MYYLTFVEFRVIIDKSEKERYMMNEQHRAYRPAELAKKLGVSTTTLWRWRKDGYLPEPSKLGPKLIFWDASVINKWMQSNI